MYQRIMVPVDGSELAECVLPHVESVAMGCNSREVVFVRVVEPVQIPSGTFSEGGAVYDYAQLDQVRKDMEQQNRAEADQYLHRLQSRVSYGDAKVRTEVLVGSVANTLIEYAEENNVDLVVISTHGRSGIGRWVWGSTADKIMRSGTAPVLMVRASGCASDS